MSTDRNLFLGVLAFESGLINSRQFIEACVLWTSRKESPLLDTYARFLREAKFTGQLEHPGIVPVYNVAERQRGREPFYTMRFVNGRTLADSASEFHESRANGNVNFLDMLPLLDAFVAVRQTIAYAHSQGIIHRDLKGKGLRDRWR